MKKRGPVLTLLVVGLFMAGMFVANMTNAKRPKPVSAAAATLSSSTRATATTTSASPVPTAVTSATSPESTESSGFPPQAAYTGWTADHTASIAIAVKADRAVAYLCDGTNLESWLRGKARDGALTLSGKSGDSLTGRLSGNAVSGEISVRGKSLAFSTQLTTSPGGLYTATVAATQARVTWIVRGDGGQTGLLIADGQQAPAPRLDPAKGVASVDGKTVQAEPVAGDFESPS
jgi:hypothetical protein